MVDSRLDRRVPRNKLSAERKNLPQKTTLVARVPSLPGNSISSSSKPGARQTFSPKNERQLCDFLLVLRERTAALAAHPLTRSPARPPSSRASPRAPRARISSRRRRPSRRSGEGPRRAEPRSRRPASTAQRMRERSAALGSVVLVPRSACSHSIGLRDLRFGDQACDGAHCQRCVQPSHRLHTE